MCDTYTFPNKSHFVDFVSTTANSIESLEPKIKNKTMMLGKFTSNVVENFFSIIRSHSKLVNSLDYFRIYERATLEILKLHCRNLPYGKVQPQFKKQYYRIMDLNIFEFDFVLKFKNRNIKESRQESKKAHKEIQQLSSTEKLELKKKLIKMSPIQDSNTIHDATKKSIDLMICSNCFKNYSNNGAPFELHKSKCSPCFATCFSKIMNWLHNVLSKLKCR
jgi:hypothetical protein